jgi:alanyl aminopeptidase|nr:M1 family aminopeptidase [Kofleriaceae bacterium]
MTKLAWVAVLAAVACGHPAPLPPPPRPVVVVAPPPPPGLRLPHDLEPTAYELALDLDPDAETFHGHVTIHVRVAVATDRVWLHAVDLDIASARVGDVALEPIAKAGTRGADPMRGYKLPRVAPVGSQLALDFDYTGKTTGDQQGLFRQQAGGRWYLYAQGESVFARRIVPCFDEPGFKAPWTVKLTVPAGDVALANAPQTSERAQSNNRREVAFAPTAPMPAYLLSVAVGPFDVVDAGRIGRNNIPLRVAVPAGDRDRAGVASAWVGKLVGKLEDYFDEPIPLAKLDLVAVPEFFGAMENPGLVTVVAGLLVGDAASADFGRKFAEIAAHELAHQWLGDAVTMPWWDDLWLSEATATWLGDQVAGELGAFDDPPLRAALNRAHALAADAEPGAKPLHREVARGDDPEAGFDAIAYDKGGAVLAMIERAAGPDRMRAALRAYVRAHAGGVATATDFIAALAREAPDAARALASYVDHAGTPIVDLELRCDRAPRIAASVRRSASAVVVPLCVRYEAGSGQAETCAIVDSKVELALPQAQGCPSWVTGNADGVGYYEVEWSSVGTGPMAPLPSQTPAERLVYGSDVAAALVRGDIAVTAALAEMRRLAAGNDPYGDLAATEIARAIEPYVDDATVGRWADYLVARFPPRLTANAMLAPATPALRELRDTLLELVPADHLPPATVRAARGELDRVLARLQPARPGAGRPRAAVVASELDTERFVLLAAIAGPSGGAKLFETIAKLARDATDDDLRFALVAALGHFGSDLVDRAASLVLDGQMPPSLAWVALRGYVERDATRAAAWVAIAPRVGELVATLTQSETAELVDSAGSLCGSAERDAVAATLEPHVAEIQDGRAAIDRTLARIDRCVARRDRAGGISVALRP